MGFLDGGLGGIVGGVGSLIGGAIGGITSNSNANMNYNAQKEFAQNGIRWRVEDAKRAGIHPLYALGASTSSFSPVQSYGGDYGVGDALRSFGQGIDRAAQAKMTKEERAIAQANLERQEVRELADYNLRKQESDAKTLMFRSEALRNYAASQQALRRTGLPPALPSGRKELIDGQGNSFVTPDTYKPGTGSLMQLSRMGNLLVEHIDPDISDSLTEDAIKNLAVIISSEGQAQSGRLDAEVMRHLTSREREAIARGDASIVRIPDVGWQFLWKPEVAPRYSKDRREVSGKIVF